MLNLLKLLDAVVLKIMVFGILYTITINSSASTSVTPMASVTADGKGNPSNSMAAVMIPASQEAFIPFVLAVQPQTTVVWLNNDKAPHTITTTPDSSSFLNPEPISMTLAIGQHASRTFTKPGIYDYYDNTEATWNTTDHRVAAKKGVPNFPLSMEGVIWVQGHINGLPSTAMSSMPGKDAFSPGFTAINVGGSVSWQNTDGDLHAIMPVPGWPQPINPLNFSTISVPGAQNGRPQTKMMTFSTAGLYYYYCPPHASVNLTLHRAQAHTTASEFPIPMDGFVLVSS